MKYRILICAILKDETPYLIEWIEHHLKIGIEHFVLYDNNSAIPAKQTLDAYVKKGIVEVFDCKITNTPQLKVYTNCLYSMHDDTDWIAFIDIDEFIVLKKHNDIHSFLWDYKNFAGVCLNWLIYSANNHVSRPEGLVMQNYTEPTPPNFTANSHVKSIVRPRYVNIMDSSHFARYAKNYCAVNEKYELVSRAHSPFSNDIAQINHYFTKSFEEWLDKIGRGIADSNGIRKVDEFWLYNPGMLPRKAEIEMRYKEAIERINRLRTE